MLVRKSVLMVDDNLELVDAVRGLFDAKEFLFVGAKDGAEGLLKAQKQKFDVIVTDIRMPRMDGTTFIQEYRRLVKAETPILIYSGHLDELPVELRSIKQLYRLAKPAQGFDLIQRVRNLANPETQATQKLGIQKLFEAQEVIFREGDPGAEGFVIEKGKVVVSKLSASNQELTLEVLEAGDFLGSVVPSESQYRFFTARAGDTPVVVTIVPQAQMAKELEQRPEWFKKMVLGSHQRLVAAYLQLRNRC